MRNPMDHPIYGGPVALLALPFAVLLLGLQIITALVAGIALLARCLLHALPVKDQTGGAA